MTEQQLLERIAIHPKVMAGKPVIRGTRLTVEHIYLRMAQPLRKSSKSTKD